MKEEFTTFLNILQSQNRKLAEEQVVQRIKKLFVGIV